KISTNSPSQSNYKKRAQKSSVWPHFDLDTPDYSREPVCKKCKDVFSTSSGVSTLQRHLKEHQIVAPAICQTTFHFPRTDPHNDEKQKIKNDKLITWIIVDQQPFTVVNNQFFKEFINFLDL
ncbi:10740_t:CDS:1, partial [Cetraspora pellucida]